MEEEKGKKFSLESLKNDNELITFYTGFPNFDRCMSVFNYVTSKDEVSIKAGRPCKLNKLEEFFLVLVKLKVGLFSVDLAVRFNVSRTTVQRIFTKWMKVMYEKLASFVLWPSREFVDNTMPAEFKEKYPTTRVILDATELKCETPKSFLLKSETFSNYKSCNTFKGLIGVLPNGFVCFVSALYSGSISDRELSIRSGFINLEYNEGDSVMADKGFTIADLLAKKQVILNIPPFLRGKDQFTESETVETEKIASVRILVERRIGRIKNFHIFDRAIPLTLAPQINKIWTVCTILTNFFDPIIANVEFED